jgi:alkanesulfonate monooxygenase SsuD/methylene tetrahydromethanopterin reductase-like flavin-dependent oxidoreductase (luciferase family)
MTQRGLFVPPFDALADPRVVADLAVDAEAAGWDGFFVWDHLLYADPVRAIADPWVCCAAVAARTTRLVLGPMVTPLSRRRPHVLARQAASLDLLSNGRLVLGFGLGDDGDVGELSRFGEETDAKTRAAMLDEGLELLAGLLSGARVQHEGTYFTARHVELLPPATRPGGIPVWIAGRWPNRAPLRRAARWDGLFVIGTDAPADVRAASDALAALRAEHGRTRAASDLVVRIQPGDAVEPWADAGATWVLTQVGPYAMDLDAVRKVVRSGP